MKKVLIGLVAVFCVGLGIFWIYIDEIVGNAISRGGSAALGVQTHVDFVRISPFDGKLLLNGLEIANPPDFDSSQFLRVSSGQIDADLGTLDKPVVEISRITMEDVEVSLDRNHHGTNYAKILDNVKHFEASDSSKTDDSNQRYVVREFQIRDIDARVEWSSVASDKTALSVKIPQIEFRDLGAKDGRGVTMGELTSIFTKAILQSIVRYGVNLPSTVRDGLELGLGGVALVTGVVVKGASNTVVDVAAGLATGVAGEGAGGKIQGAGDDAIDGVGRAIDAAGTKGSDVLGGVGDALGSAEDKVLGGLREATGGGDEDHSGN